MSHSQVQVCGQNPCCFDHYLWSCGWTGSLRFLTLMVMVLGPNWCGWSSCWRRLEWIFHLFPCCRMCVDLLLSHLVYLLEDEPCYSGHLGTPDKLVSHLAQIDWRIPITEFPLFCSVEVAHSARSAQHHQFDLSNDQLLVAHCRKSSKISCTDPYQGDPRFWNQFYRRQERRKSSYALCKWYN